LREKTSTRGYSLRKNAHDIDDYLNGICVEKSKTSYIHSCCFEKNANEKCDFKGNALETRQSRIHRNGPTWPINITVGLILTLPKCNQMPLKTKNVKFGT
jgi:hypothetical protein